MEVVQELRRSVEKTTEEWYISVCMICILEQKLDIFALRAQRYVIITTQRYVSRSYFQYGFVSNSSWHVQQMYVFMSLIFFICL